jgi:thiol-disulfide isomerase/thioredoxin
MTRRVPKQRSQLWALLATAFVITAGAVYVRPAPHRTSGSIPGAATDAVIERADNSRPPAPRFQATVLGTDRTLSQDQLARTVIVLEFWSSWCEPCRQEAGALKQAGRLLPANVQIVGDDVEDNAADALAALRRAGVTYPSLWDPHGSIARDYRVIGTPTIVFIDRGGRIMARALGSTSAATIMTLAGQALAAPARTSNP